MVLVIAGLESMAMLGIIVIVVSSGQLRSGEALSRSLGWAILEIYGLPYLILAMPALLLAALCACSEPAGRSGRVAGLAVCLTARWTAS